MQAGITESDAKRAFVRSARGLRRGDPYGAQDALEEEVGLRLGRKCGYHALGRTAKREPRVGGRNADI